MTDVGIWGIIGLIGVYLGGSTAIYFSGLSKEDRVDVTHAEVSYNGRFWWLLMGGAIISLISGGLFYLKFGGSLVSAILFGSGLMSALTAFVTPKYNEKTRLDNADEFS